MKTIYLNLLLMSLLTSLNPNQLTAQLTLDPADEAALRRIVQNIQDGWNQRNGALFASGFADGHDYVVINGMHLSKVSAKMNADMHDQLWRTKYSEGSTLVLGVKQIRLLRPDLALVHATGGNDYVMQGAAHHVDLITTLVVEKQGADWRIVSFHNSPVQGPPAGAAARSTN